MTDNRLQMTEIRHPADDAFTNTPCTDRDIIVALLFAFIFVALLVSK